MGTTAAKAAMSLGNAEWVLWAAAALALVLMVFAGPVAEAALSRSRDLGTRVFRLVLYLVVPALAFFPAIVVLATDVGAGLGLGLLIYVVLFSSVCYHFGKRVGTAQGRKHISDLVGLDSPDSTEDAQDRLFESRMRFPARSDVVKSIGEMAKKNEAERLEAEKRAVRQFASPADKRAAASSSSVAEVQVDDVVDEPGESQAKINKRM